MVPLTRKPNQTSSAMLNKACETQIFNVFKSIESLFSACENLGTKC